MDRLQEIYEFYRTIHLIEKYCIHNYKIYTNDEEGEYYCMMDMLNTGIASYNHEYPLIKIKLNYLMFNRADRFDISFSRNARYVSFGESSTNNLVIRSMKHKFNATIMKECLKWKK